MYIYTDKSEFVLPIVKQYGGFYTQRNRPAGRDASDYRSETWPAGGRYAGLFPVRCQG